MSIAPARRQRSIPRPRYPVDRAVLDNGLRVVLAPTKGSGVVGIAVHYDVGFRSEPQGRTGFAHLFEHLMFQGSESLPKLEHFRLVQSSGGTFNGSTHVDYTDYYEVLPSAGLERGLFLEADRMRAPKITAENLTNQVEVVSEEIRLNVLNRPYGGFPWILLPPVLFDSFANSHNGYGDFVDLQSATVADCADFFETYYTPANAVLTICGDFDPGMALDLASSHFSDIPHRPAPTRPSFAEPELTSVRRSVQVDPLAPAPAAAAGWQMPDPVEDLPNYVAHMLLSIVLSDGEASRLQKAVVTPGIATEAWAAAGLMGSLDARAPDVFVLGALHTVDTNVDDVLGACGDQLGQVAAKGPTSEELERAVVKFCAGWFASNDSVVARCRALGVFELLHGRAELVSDLPDLLSGVTVDQVAAAAARLDLAKAAILEIVPGGSVDELGDAT